MKKKERIRFYQSKDVKNRKRRARQPVTIFMTLLLLSVLLLTSGCSGKRIKTEDLKEQMNAYISAAKADGTLKAMEERWFSEDEAKKTLDFSNLTEKNGTIVFGTKTMVPFSYKKGDSYAGMVPEMMLSFCQQYGYKIKFMDYSDTNSMVLAVSSGKCDLAGATVSVTEERKKMIDYSDAYFENSGVIIMNQEDAAGFSDINSLKGKRIGVLTGTIYHEVISQKVSNADIYEYNTPADMCQALLSGKVDAAVHDSGVMRYALNNYKTEKIVGTLIDDDWFAFVFPKTSGNTQSAVGRIVESVKRTLIEEDRWKQVLYGIGTTVLITVMSILAGMVLGFILCMALRKNNQIVVKLIDGFSWLIRGLPTVVLLLIMYYVVFGSVSVSGTIVSTISFSLIFAVTVCGLLTNSIRAVDKGQFEACAALGYKEKEGFMRIIMPQVIGFSLPGFKTEVIALIKATSIVGYIAVQDLTKTADIIRSSTYEAFMPLILIAIIYFILAWALTKIVDGIGMIFEKRTSLEQFLKGVDRHVGN